MPVLAQRRRQRPAARAQLNGQGRTLILTSARRAARFRDHAADATVMTDAAALDGVEARFDAAVVDGVLENERWDRWVLQRVHRALRLDAPIVVVVSPLLSLASAADARFLAYAARKLLVRLAQRWSPTFDLPGAVHRRYWLPRLVRTMESLGYAGLEAKLQWNGRASLRGRKASSLSGVRGRGWPDAAAHRRWYAEEHGHLFAAREAWLSNFPQFRGPDPRALDPAEWRDCRVLVLSPHPDDELIGCGGTLRRLRSAGAEISIVQATDGSSLHSLNDLPPARRKSIRLEEAGRVAAALGARLTLWRREDSRLRCCAETIAQLSTLLDELRPTHVFTPFLGDPHADHRTLSLILAAALDAARVDPEVLQYEVWSLVPANRYCEITGEAQALEKLLLLYERAMRADDFVHFCESRNLARALELTGRPGYVEAYLSTSGVLYKSLAARAAL